MSKFNGFPHGKFTQLPTPPQFFSQLLAQIDDLAELKLTLFCFYALTQRDKQSPYLRRRHFEADDALMQGLMAGGSFATPADALTHALACALARGTLLATDILLKQQEETLYFVNTPKGRKAVEQIKQGNWRPDSSELGIEILPERPNAFTLYEQNIGILTAHIADELKDAQSEYPPAWLEEAIKLACEANKRNWRYIRGILVRWKQEGRSTDAVSERHSLQDGKRFVSGKYADLLDH
jgi:DnaD/phage-associated family protein